MENPIPFTLLNDFIFCPVSIYYHGFYEGVESLLFTDEKQLRGKSLHENIDNNDWTQSNVLCSLFVYSEEYGLCGKIDKYYPEDKKLVESKALIKEIYDGYIFQLYALYFAMLESGFEIEVMFLYSIRDHKSYAVDLPCENALFLSKFVSLIEEVKSFDPEGFKQSNPQKCMNCIYSHICEWGG